MNPILRRIARVWPAVCAAAYITVTINYPYAATDLALTLGIGGMYLLGALTIRAQQAIDGSGRPAGPKPAPAGSYRGGVERLTGADPAPYYSTTPPGTVPGGRPHVGRHLMSAHQRRRPLLLPLAVVAATLALLGAVNVAATTTAPVVERHTRTVPTAVAWHTAALGATLPAAVRAVTIITVRAGDTLWAYAARYCGNPNLYPKLAAGNGIANPNRIFVGQRVTITCTGGPVLAPQTVTARTTSTGWLHPLASSARASSCWGAPRSGHTHKGVDINAPSGTPIRAVGAGQVELVRYESGGAGHYVIVNHGSGIRSVYMHLRTRSPLAVGTRVAAGRTVGYVGTTGNAKGPHLHFEIHSGLWHPVNPAPFLRARGVQVGC